MTDNVTEVQSRKLNVLKHLRQRAKFLSKLTYEKSGPASASTGEQPASSGTKSYSADFICQLHGNCYPLVVAAGDEWFKVCRLCFGAVLQGTGLLMGYALPEKSAVACTIHAQNGTGFIEACVLCRLRRDEELGAPEGANDEGDVAELTIEIAPS